LPEGTAWPAVGQVVYVAGGGHYEVIDGPNFGIVPPDTLVALFTFKRLGYAGDATTGVTVSAGAAVTPSGVIGPSGSGGIGLYSALPGSPSTGQLYYPTDGSGPWIYDGTLWRPVVGGVVAYAPPSAGSFTLVNANAGAFTMANDAGRIRMTATTQGVSGNYYLRGGFVPMTGGVNSAIVEGCLHNASFDNAGASRTPGWGVAFRESGTGKMAAVVVGFSPTYGRTALHGRWASPTDFSGGGAIWLCVVPDVPNLFIRARLDSTQVHFEYSLDRSLWHELTLPQDKVWAFTTAPDQVGIVCEYFSENFFSAKGYCSHFRQS
jgi:hypothetical protein